MRFSSATKQRSTTSSRHGRHMARHAFVGSMAVSALLMLVAPASAGTSQHAPSSQASVHPDFIFPPPPSCGDSISLQSVKYAFDRFSFKIVGVDLSQWLGRGYGFMTWQAGVVNQSEPYESGDVNASGSGGARTGTITLYPVKVGQTLVIDVEIRHTVDGSDLCLSEFRPKAEA